MLFNIVKLDGFSGADTSTSDIQRVTVTNCDPTKPERCHFEAGSKTHSQVKVQLQV
jgi:hypothetical protein